MERTHLLSFIKKTHKFYSNDSTPQDVYYNLRNNKDLKPALGTMLTGKDIIMYSFLVPKFKEGGDIDELYDAINHFFIGFQLAHIDEHNPNIPCDNCDDGLVQCNECWGSGEVTCHNCNGSGNTDCGECDGDGIDSDGDSCYNCDGSGEEQCKDCRGSSEVTCDNCDNGYLTCDECDGDGKIESTDKVLITKTKYLTYHPEIYKKLEQMEEGDVFDESILDMLFESNSIIKLYSFVDYSDYDYFLEKEDGTYIFETEIKNPRLSVQPYTGDVTMIWRSES
jgi:hypothetical protein